MKKKPSPKKSAARADELKWSGCSDIGKVRKNNEDSFLGLQFDSREVQRLGKIGEASMEKMDFTFAVSDGMGGALAGEYASQIAVEKITTLLPRSFGQSATGLEAGFTDVLTELFGQIHRALAYLGSSYEECAGMQTTLSLCWFTPGWMYFGHIGDSRIYHLPAKKNEIRQLTHDDTHVGWLFRSGQINEREAHASAPERAAKGARRRQPVRGPAGRRGGLRARRLLPALFRRLERRALRPLPRGHSARLGQGR